jgi:hypothetical protein
MKNKNRIWVIVSAFLLPAVSCSSDVNVEESDGREKNIGEAQQPLFDSAHRRVINECSQAMTGNWWTYNETNWPLGDKYATYAYSLADQGAWNLLMANFGRTLADGTKQPAYFVSCLHKKGVVYYYPCGLLAYGSSQMPYYTCQGSCLSGSKVRGGQCKPFMNLVAYRSGTYQNPGYRWKSFPSDACIACSNCDEAHCIRRSDYDAGYPKATFANIVEVDYLRRPYGHAAIVVRKVSSTRVVVLDANWLTGDGNEVVGSHELGFTGTGSLSDLGTYRVLKCAYTGAC